MLLVLLLFGTQMLPALLLAIHILAANPALRQRLCATGFACAQVHSLQRGSAACGWHARAWARAATQPPMWWTGVLTFACGIGTGMGWWAAAVGTAVLLFIMVSLGH